MKVYLLGIGGISMSGIAYLLHNNGYEVCGSDVKQTKITDNLEKLGIKINYEQVSKNITSDIDLVVYTAAISNDNEELNEAKKLGIKLIDRASIMGDIIKEYSNSISISGSHGKTTTTSLVSSIFLNLENKPTILVGGILPLIGSNVYLGGKDYFISEACEYKNSFLSFNSKHAIVLNIDSDHLDFFKDLDEIRKSFKLFIDKLTGILVINESIDNLDELIKDTKAKVVKFGYSEYADYRVGKIEYLNDKTKFEVITNNEIFEFTANVKGQYNVENAVSAIAIAMELGVDLDSIENGLFNFISPNRRFEYYGKIDRFEIYDDYAHHPTEITAVLNNLDNINKNNLCVFCPHTYSRTKDLFEEFAMSLSKANKVIISPIFPAREKFDPTITEQMLVDKINDFGGNALYVGDYEKIAEYILKNSNEDLIATIGAGDVNEVINILKNKVNML